MKAVIQALLRPFGLRLIRLQNIPKPQFGEGVLLSTLKRFGFSPKHILDIGANHGNWTRSAVQFFPEAQYTLVEPQDHLKVHVQDLIAVGVNLRWISAGIADRSGTLPFHVSRRDDSSTFAPHVGSVFSGTALLEVKSIDDLLQTSQLSVPDLVKIDAEGMDLKVLQGATRILGITDVFLVEASVISPIENSALRVMEFMDEKGYRLIDITEMNRSPRDGVLWLTELAFLRKSSRLLDGANSYE